MGPVKVGGSVRQLAPSGWRVAVEGEERECARGRAFAGRACFGGAVLLENVFELVDQRRFELEHFPDVLLKLGTVGRLDVETCFFGLRQ